MGAVLFIAYCIRRSHDDRQDALPPIPGHCAEPVRHVNNPTFSIDFTEASNTAEYMSLAESQTASYKPMAVTSPATYAVPAEMDEADYLAFSDKQPSYYDAAKQAADGMYATVAETEA